MKLLSVLPEGDKMTDKPKRIGAVKMNDVVNMLALALKAAAHPGLQDTAQTLHGAFLLHQARAHAANACKTIHEFAAVCVDAEDNGRCYVQSDRPEGDKP